MIPDNYISWDFAKDAYGVSEYWLTTLSCINPKICDYDRKIVRNLWSK